jgi:acid stress chaperone HdeB
MSKVAIVAVIALVGLSNWAIAQVTFDMAKITCDQFSGYKITNPDKIAVWLSGYYNGKRGNTVIDTQRFDENSKKLLLYCVQNPKMSVMDAVDKVLSPDNR